MSKYVKNLLTEHLREQLRGVQDALVVNMVGSTLPTTTGSARSCGPKTSASWSSRTASPSGRPADSAGPAFEGLSGSAAVCWGSEDIVSLAKEITKLARDAVSPHSPLAAAVMDGEKMTAEQVQQ